MGSLERRLAALEAQLASMWDTNPLEEQIGSETLALLCAPEIKRVIAGLRRVRERYAGMPPDTPIPAEAWEELLTEEELRALTHLQELKAELREKAAG